MAHKPPLPSLVLFLVLLLGEPGYVIPEEQLPLANHVVEVTAFVADGQIGSTEVTVPTCKLTAISPLTRESVHFCQGPGVCVCMCVRVCVCIRVTHAPLQCVSQCMQAQTSAHTSSPVFSSCRSFQLLSLHDLIVLCPSLQATTSGRLVLFGLGGLNLAMWLPPLVGSTEEKKWSVSSQD